MTAVDLVSLMSASFIYVGCQGLDLRVMHENFLESLQPIVKTITNQMMGLHFPIPNIDDLHTKLFKNITSVWTEANSLDAMERCEKAASTSVSVLVSSLCIQQGWDNQILIEHIEAWRIRMLGAIQDAYVIFRAQFFKNQTTVEYLG
jgi:phenylalanine ammonia-lyase